MADYTISFGILATDTDWNEPALLTSFHDDLNLEIQLELACRDQGLDLNGCIMLAIKLDQHLHHQLTQDVIRRHGP